MQRLNGHRTAELRSLAYHRRVAEKIADAPALLANVAAHLEASIQKLGPDSVASLYARGWLRKVSGPRSELFEFMLSDTEEARDFRQASPFVGFLTSRERWQLWRTTASTVDPLA